MIVEKRKEKRKKQRNRETEEERKRKQNSVGEKKTSSGKKYTRHRRGSNPRSLVYKTNAVPLGHCAHLPTVFESSYLNSKSLFEIVYWDSSELLSRVYDSILS